MDCNEARELLPARIDHELDGRQALDVAHHIESCTQCKAEHDALQSLRDAVKTRATYFAAPGALRGRLEDRLFAVQNVKPAPGRRKWTPFTWLNAAGALASLIAVVWSVGLLLALPSAEDRLADEIVSSYVRSLISGHTVDVASSDQHTVKPWFNGKIDFAPPVVDLTPSEFPLLGGRLDYLAHRPVAALVYRHRQHAIDLFVFPAINEANAGAKNLSERGYNMLHWIDRGMAFWAVSDIDAAELTRFRQALLNLP